METKEELDDLLVLIGSQTIPNLISEVIEDVSRELNKGEAFSETWTLPNHRIGQLYVSLLVIEARLFKKKICFGYTIKKNKMTDGDNKIRKFGESYCKFNFKVEMFACHLV